MTDDALPWRHEGAGESGESIEDREEDAVASAFELAETNELGAEIAKRESVVIITDVSAERTAGPARA